MTKNKGIVFDIINHIFLLAFALICLYPFYYILIYSISNPGMADVKGVFLLPANLDFINYKKLLSRSDIYNAIFISASRAVVGTIFTILCSSLFAYLLSKKELIFRKAIYRLTVLTMYVNAGLIPWYITMKAIGLKNSYLLYILPFGVGAFFVILIKTYIEQLPPALEEAAKVDGAGYFKIFMSVVFPLSKPILATVAIFSAVGQWNSWQDNFFLVNNPKLMTLQLMLYNYLSTSAASDLSSSANRLAKATTSSITSMSIKMTMAVITVIPIVIVYPAMQKYFIKGIMLGAVKG